MRESQIARLLKILLENKKNSGKEYRASGDVICESCKFPYRLHPRDYSQLSYDNHPFLHILCNGDRVKL